MSVWRRVRLTYKYDGLGVIVYRILTFPLRFTPLKRHLRLGPWTVGDQVAALRWYKGSGRPASIVISCHRDGGDPAGLVAGIRRTTRSSMVAIIVVGDAAHLEPLSPTRGLELIAVAQEDSGFTANVNRGVAAADPRQDVVVLDSSVKVGHRGWLECLQYATERSPDVGIVGPRLLSEDGRVHCAGLVRSRETPERFDGRYRQRPGDWGPVTVAAPVLAVSGACMYLRSEALDQLGAMEATLPDAYGDVDYCLRAWHAGWRVMYWPAARLVAHVPAAGEEEPGEGECRRIFWRRWAAFFEQRPVRDPDGGLRVIYVTEDTGVGGGHRDVFEHVNGLLARGHHPQVWSLSGQPEWFDLHVGVRRFQDYEELIAALAAQEAIKVATWWNTAAPVWQASILRGIPVFFVQDIETSYYPSHEEVRDAVLASYRPEFQFMTISSWNRDRLRELGLDAQLIPPGIDLGNFRALPDVTRRPDLVLALGRSQPLKNLPLTIDAWRTLPEPRPELCLFGIEPQLAGEPGMSYVQAPTDEQVNELFNLATVFVQTSTHEGFCLPPLESMATGGAVVCTDAHGNRDFCVDGQNCLIPEATPAAVGAALRRLLGDAPLRERLGAAGMATAVDYAWEPRIDALEAFLVGVAGDRRVDRAGAA